MRAKLERLAQWRIDPSSITFPENAPESHGSFGSVSQALWAVPSTCEDGADQSANPKKEVESATGVPGKSGPGIPESGGDSDVGREKEGGRKFIVGTVATLWNQIWDFTMWGLGRRGAAYKTVAVKRMKISGDFERILGINILVNSENHAVITDFGSARRLTGKDLEKGTEPADNTAQPELPFEAMLSSNTITLTSNGYTLRWAAPELLNGEGAGLWSDIWALGWVAYEPIAVPNPRGDRAGRMSHSPELLVKLGEMHIYQGDYTNGLKYSIEALGACTEITNIGEKAAALLGLANVHRLRNEYSEAVNFYSQCL
ncbi:hypothetical protein FRC01_006923 [Tulasnella sp. 417]|nr:hypothetical protein FRC01_006923 [Tulasnella sp. 417]